MEKVKEKSLFAKIFAEQDPKPTIKDPEKIKKKYNWLQPAIFVSLFLLYFSSYLGRKQLAIGFNGAPGNDSMGIEAIFNLGAEVYSTLGMIYYFCYAVGKFLGGILADKANIRVCLPLSVAVSSLFPLGIVLACNLFSNGSVSEPVMIAIMYISWGLSGFIQAASFPMCGKTLTFWYSNNNRAKIWSFWSTSHELGSAASLGLATYLVTYLNWEAVFYVPALISVSVSILAFFLLRDKPVSLGLPNVEEYAHTAAAKVEKEVEEEVDTRSQWQVFTQEILRSKTIWILSLAFISVYIMRVGPTDWLPKMLENDSLGAVKAIIVPACGCLGTLSIPWVSDKLFGGRRAPAIFIYFLVATLCFIGLRLISVIEPGVPPTIPLEEHVSDTIQIILYALLGIATYGPLVMIGGVAAIESASKRVAAAATGFTGAMGYLGAILMSYLGRYRAQLGNEFIYHVWILSGIVAMILIFLLWNQKANKEYSN